MNHAAIPVENAMAVHYLHLGNIAGNSQILLNDIGERHAQETNQPLNVILIERDRSFTMAAITTSFAFEYIVQLIAPLVDEHPKQI